MSIKPILVCGVRHFLLLPLLIVVWQYYIHLLFTELVAKNK